MRARYASVLLTASALAAMTAATASAAPAQYTSANAKARTTQDARVSAPLTVAAQATPGYCDPLIGGGRGCIVPTQVVGSLPLPYSEPIIFDRSTGLPTIVQGENIEITCWYYGNPPSGWASDGVLDHAIKPITGHISDVYVNLGGENPWQAPYSLPQC
jgi:hypothetical protein